MRLLDELRDILRLSRWGNLVFILVLEAVAYFFIHHIDYPTAMQLVSKLPLLIMSTVLIAAGGYLINDYFDLAIDSVNKPKRVAIIKRLGSRTLIKWHIIFTTLGLIMAVIVAYKVGKFRLVGFQIFSVLCLFFYSFIFKQKLLIGNLIIGILSVTSLILLPVYAYRSIFYTFLVQLMPASLVYIFSAVAVFSFLLTIIREMIKDCEDVVGDASHGCRTLPIVIGTRSTNYVVALLSLASIVAYYHYYGLLLGGGFLSISAFVLFVVLMVVLIARVLQSRVSTDYARQSNLVKAIMAYGLFTSILLLYYV